jgi:hypothetical protein
MALRAGFEREGKEDWVMRLMKGIYGLCQAFCIWNRTFHDGVSDHPADHANGAYIIGE